METISRRNFMRGALMGGAGLALAGMAGCAAEKKPEALAEAGAPESQADFSADVVILGGGAAGLMAAAGAMEGGSTVLLIEKAGAVGGDSKLAVGVQGCWPERRAADGGRADDSAEEYLADWIESFPRSFKGMRGDAQPTEHPFAEQYLSIFPDFANYLVDTVGVPLLPYGEETADPDGYGWMKKFSPGNELDVCVNAPIGRCWWYADEPVTTIIQRFNEGRGSYTEVCGCEATELTVDADGRVTGVVFYDEGGVRHEAHANKSVVLATGSYCANPGMISRYVNPRWAGFRSAGVFTNTGDGHRMAQAIGAELADMDLGIIFQGVPDGTSDVLLFDHYTGNFNARPGALAEHVPGIAVNIEGKRIEAESRGKIDIMTKAADEKGAICYYVSDAAYDPAFFTDSCSLVYQADTLEDLAAQMRVDPAGFTAEVARYNGFVESGVDEDFAKEMGGVTKIEKAPFWAVRVLPNPYVTMGGVATDPDSHVLTSDGAAIAGLYAAGLVCGSYWEREGLTYTGGFNQALAFGLQAGWNAAQEAGEGETFGDATLLSAAATAQRVDTGSLADGTYTGTGAGMGGDINVTLEVSSGRISVSDISPNNETVGIGGYEAIEDGTFKMLIEEAQGANIDAISGATITSTAISDAVAEALGHAAS